MTNVSSVDDKNTKQTKLGVFVYLYNRDLGIIAVGLGVAFALVVGGAVGATVVVARLGAAKLVAIWIGKERWVNRAQCLAIDRIGVVVIFFKIHFFQTIVHCVNGSFALVIALRRFGCDFFTEKEPAARCKESDHNDELNNGKSFTCLHGVIIACPSRKMSSKGPLLFSALYQ